MQALLPTLREGFGWNLVRRTAARRSLQPWFAALLILLAAHALRAQDDEYFPKEVPAQDITIESMASYGDWRILAGGHDCKLYTSGVEYDRNSWGHLLGARFDYVGEVLPVVILNEPAKADVFGNPKSLDRKIVPGVAVTPIGFRLMWRDRKRVKPYFTLKTGIVGYPIKVLSSEASYVNLTLQQGIGLQVDLTDRMGLRLGLFNDFHFSDAFIVPVDPGLDVMNSNLGLTWHFPARSE